jgi:hypothetical protein
MWLVLKPFTIALWNLFIYCLLLMPGPIFLSHSTAKQCEEEDESCKSMKTGFAITGSIWLILGLFITYYMVFPKSI